VALLPAPAPPGFGSGPGRAPRGRLPRSGPSGARRACPLIPPHSPRAGRATGEAYVQLRAPEDTADALKLNKKYVGRRYIE
jgi:hypothetical protein